MDSILLMGVLLTFVAGALWRRAYGGWLGGRRWMRYAVTPLLTWSAWLLLPWWGVALVTIAVAAFFAPKHVVDDASVWRRYGPFAIAYRLAQKYWNPKWNQGGFIDGWIAVGELGLGGLVWGSLTTVFVVLWKCIK